MKALIILAVLCLAAVNAGYYSKYYSGSSYLYPSYKYRSSYYYPSSTYRSSYYYPSSSYRSSFYYPISSYRSSYYYPSSSYRSSYYYPSYYRRSYYPRKYETPWINQASFDKTFDTMVIRISSIQLPSRLHRFRFCSSMIYLANQIIYKL